ncbi:MAG: 3-hydroxybutyryl-CoA dehydrogenase [Treponema sp.]|nr:3-hydroxybutyryl-CoA dehydrogenase [Treponema sp.]
MPRKIGVLGAGQMGNGIAHVFSAAGHEVRLYDIAESQLAKAKDTIAKNLDRQAKKGAIDAGQISAILSRIGTTTRLEDMADIDFAVEAAVENEALKLELFRRLDGIAPPGAILATNTSSIPITKIASATRRPEKVIGMHFMNPVPVMTLVEVIRGHSTADETFAVTAELVARLGKEMAVSQDYPGFIANRILMPMLNEAIFALYEGVASADDIDKAMKLGTNQPMGPLALADFIGLDTVLAILRVLHDGFGDPKFRPCPLLVKMVNAGHLGRKTGRGFHKYD